MSKPAKVTIHKLPTGVRGLDDILGGGIPEFSFNVIAGTPGCGKTTLAHQTDKGMVVIHPRRTDYNGLITGIPTRTGLRQTQEDEAAPEPKATQ